MPLTFDAPTVQAAEIEDERALVDSYGMLGKGIQEAIEIHNSRLGQMRRAVSSKYHYDTASKECSCSIIKLTYIYGCLCYLLRCNKMKTLSSSSRTKSRI